MSFQAAQELDPTKFATADLTLGYDYNTQDPVFNVPFFAVEVGCFVGEIKPLMFLLSVG